MDKNTVIQEIINTVRKDILTNKDFISELLAGNPSKGIPPLTLREENIPYNLILKIMNELNLKQVIKQPVQNAPKDVVDAKKGKVAARPIAVGQNSVESKIVSDLLEGNNVYLMGKAGTGKTYLAKAIAESVMYQPTYIINCSQWTSPIEIKGGQTIRGYEEGQLIKAWANGGILILDELPKLDPNTAGLLNDALAEAASQPKYDEEGNVIPDTIPAITNGKGEKVYKGQGFKDAENPTGIVPEDRKFRFCVIGTGNTNMMDVGNKYGGNQRQDYSLVDRFAGSIYTINEDIIKEKSLTYPFVFRLCNAIRLFLNKGDYVQSISLRTMLNFNRTYEQEMLYNWNSKYADTIYNNDGKKIPPKNIQNSWTSFLDMLEPALKQSLEDDNEFKNCVEIYQKNFNTLKDEFAIQFMIKYHLNVKSGVELTEIEIEELKDSSKHRQIVERIKNQS